MNIFSGFDGMACGLIALKRRGIKVDNYYASEIDKWAMQVAKKNHPEIVHLGNIRNYKSWNLPKIDLVIGGSPCQGFSLAGKQLNFNDPRSELFFIYVEILWAIQKKNPDVKFLLENVKMKKKYQNAITELMQVEPVLINSNLVSAQNRKRIYWCNWDVKQPKDKGIFLKDIIDNDSNIVRQRSRGNNKGGFKFHKSPCMGANSWTDNVHVFQFPHGCSVGDIRDLLKSPTVSAQFHNNYFPLKDLSSLEWASNLPYKILRDLGIIRKFYQHELELLQTLTKGYTSSVSYTQAAKMIGNGWTIDAIDHILSTIDKPVENIQLSF